MSYYSNLIDGMVSTYIAIQGCGAGGTIVEALNNHSESTITQKAIDVLARTAQAASAITGVGGIGILSSLKLWGGGASLTVSPFVIAGIVAVVLLTPTVTAVVNHNRDKPIQALVILDRTNDVIVKTTNVVSMFFNAGLLTAHFMPEELGLICAFSLFSGLALSALNIHNFCKKCFPQTE